MRASSPSNLITRMVAMSAQPDETDVAEDTRPATRVQRVVWAAQANQLRGALPVRLVHEIECAVVADLDSMELPEVFFTSVEIGGRVVTCDLDASGTASIFGMIEAGEYDELVEEAGDDALFGVDWDGVYITPARTRH